MNDGGRRERLKMCLWQKALFAKLNVLKLEQKPQRMYRQRHGERAN